MRTIWLASYPKSGNTWLRIFFSNLLFPELSPADPNRLPLSNLIASARSPMHEITGMPPALLTPEECEYLRPEVDEIIGRDWTGPMCLRKAHDAYTYLPDGRPLMGARPDFAAIYIVRNPWDVAVSVANHYGYSIEGAVDMMCDETMTLDRQRDRSSSQLPQRLLSWSGHVESWLSAPLDVCLVRYEDMHASPLQTFRRVLDYMDVEARDSDIERAADASSFSRLQEIEQKHGFREAPRNRRFFRAGQVGQGQRLLTEEGGERLREHSERVRCLLEKHGESLV